MVRHYFIVARCVASLDTALAALILHLFLNMHLVAFDNSFAGSPC
jgi:hypothetical protein